MKLYLVGLRNHESYPNPDYSKVSFFPTLMEAQYWNEKAHLRGWDTIIYECEPKPTP